MKFISLALPVAGLLAQQALAAPASNAPYPKRDESASFPVMRSPTSRRGIQDQNQQRADAVKETFQIAWDGYYKYAFPQDELEPLTNQGFNPRNGWGASAIDGLDTAIIMGLQPVVDVILDFVPTINFNETNDEVSMFETTIRYLGGLLSAYDLLKGPCADLVSRGDNDTSAVDELLVQAKNLADVLKFAFDSPTGIPYNDISLSSKSSTDTVNGLATIGSLVMEWTRLSDLLGDPSYGDLAAKGESYLLNPNYAGNLSSPWPGLLGTNVDIATGLFQDASGGWNGGDDSYYEYLIKMWVYNSDKYGEYKDAWIQAADSSIAHLASHPSSRPDLTFLAGFHGTDLSYSSGHLECFDGGNFILAGLTLKEQKYIDFGLLLVDACHQTYVGDVTGIGPEGFEWAVSDDPNSPVVPADQAVFYAANGFWITDSGYYLRPEVLESYYYAFQATGNETYRDWSWQGYLSINATAAAGSAYAEVVNVNTPGGGGWNNEMDSFFFAEVLKYAYMIHAPAEEWDVDNGGVNKWVFNTEAHPFKVTGTPV